MRADQMKSSEKICLDGNGLAAVLCTPAQPKALALLVHGLTGDKDQKGRYVELAELLAEKGISSLRFDMRGRGETSGYLTPLTAIEDIRTAGVWLGNQFPNLPGLVVARGEGAYASLVALGQNSVWRHMICWEAILFPRTSRELQGDYHAYRETGRASLNLPDGSIIDFTADYFEALEKLPSVYSAVRQNLQLTFIHSPNDMIAPLKYVKEFCSKARGVQSKIVSLENVADHMHIEKEFVDEYLALTMNAVDSKQG